MNLQHCQTAARLSNSKAPQTHKVPKLTYIAEQFFSVKERKLRTDEKHDTSSSRPLSPIRPKQSHQRPQSAVSYNDTVHSPNKPRTAVDVSTLHRQSHHIDPNTQTQNIRHKIKHLFSTKHETDSDDDETDDDQDMNIKQMELTQKLLKLKVNRLKQERLELEESWNTKKPKLNTASLIQHQIRNESDSEYDSHDGDSDSVGSIMTFSDNDGANSDYDDMNDNEDTSHTLSQLRKKQTVHLTHIEDVYHRLRDKCYKSELETPSVHSRRPRTAPTKSKRKYSITIPKPFAFDKRDENVETESISKRKLREYLESIKQEEDYHLNFEFKANPIPLHTVTRRIKAVHGLKGKKPARKNRFSIFQPPSKQSKTENDPDKPFTAKTVPWFVTVKLYDAMKEEENTKRKERIRDRANKLLSESSLPKRMQLHENKENVKKKKQKMKRIKKEHYKNCTFQPKINHNVPDFQKEQQKFQKRLQDLKQSKQLVKTESFSFCDKDEEKKRQKLKQEHEAKKRRKDNGYDPNHEQAKIEKKLKETQKKIKYMIANPPKIIPKSTKKFDDAVQMKRDNEQKQQMAKFLLEQEIKTKKRKIKTKWKGILTKHLVDNTAELKKRRQQSQRESIEAQKENARHWRRQKKKMMERVRARPLLVEESRMKIERERAKKKALLLVKESLTKAGITKLDDFFDESEIEQLHKMRAL
eukprot:1012983_1